MKTKTKVPDTSSMMHIPSYDKGRKEALKWVKERITELEKDGGFRTRWQKIIDRWNVLKEIIDNAFYQLSVKWEYVEEKK